VRKPCSPGRSAKAGECSCLAADTHRPSCYYSASRQRDALRAGMALESGTTAASYLRGTRHSRQELPIKEAPLPGWLLATMLPPCRSTGRLLASAARLSASSPEHSTRRTPTRDHAGCACIVRADGTGRRVLAEQLTRKPYSWTQFAGWLPDGGTAIIGSHWESPESTLNTPDRK
jgi:hypothetical protein